MSVTHDEVLKIVRLAELEVSPENRNVSSTTSADGFTASPVTCSLLSAYARAAFHGRPVQSISRSGPAPA